jgi:hypothetical protein
MASDLDLLISNSKAIEQITAGVSSWQTDLSVFFDEFEEYASNYRLIEPARNFVPTSRTKTRVGETIRATEALTTSIFRMMTAQDPSYDLVSLDFAQSSGDLFNAHLQLRHQDVVLKWKRRLLRSIRSGVLFGTTIVETPWVQQFRFGQLAFEGLGFIPRSLLQCPFEPNVFSIDESPWQAYLDYYTEGQLLDMAEKDPGNWNPDQIRKAIEESKNRQNFSTKLEERRRKAGYKDLPLYEVITYYGRLRDIPREDGRLWMIRVINESVVVTGRGNPAPTGNIPRIVARYTDFETEPYGYGVGRLGRLAQRHMDANRERYMNQITMSLFNMWLKNRLAGIRNIDLKIKPNGIIEADDISEAGLRSWAPDLNSVNFGMKLEEVLKAEHQGNTGATPGLQAQVTDASATESAIAQNEAVRRVSVIAEDMADSLVRDYQQEKQEYNAAWLQTDQYLSLPGMAAPARVNRLNMAQKAGVFVRIVTDKDFRPKRQEYLSTAIQMATSIRNQLPANVDILPIFEEWARGLDIDPRRIVQPTASLPPQTIAERLKTQMMKSQGAAQQLGAEANTGLDNAGVPGANLVDPAIAATAAQ